MFEGDLLLRVTSFPASTPDWQVLKPIKITTRHYLQANGRTDKRIKRWGRSEVVQTLCKGDPESGWLFLPHLFIHSLLT